MDLPVFSFSMKKTLIKSTLFLVSMLFAYAVKAKEWIPLTSATPAKVVATSGRHESQDITVTFHVPGYYQQYVSTSRGKAMILDAEKCGKLLVAGAPELPVAAASVIIPDDRSMEVQVLSSHYTEYSNVLVAPSKGNLKRNQDPALVPYTFGSNYSTDSFFPGSLAELRDPYILRDFRGQSVVLHPFQYNPVTRVLRVYDEVILKLIPSGHANPVNVLSRTRRPAPDVIYNEIYSSRFLNYDALQYTPAQEHGNMLVIADHSLMSTMQPFVDWKNRMGQKTEMIDVTTIGATAPLIKAYIENKYASEGLTFVLLVGDGPQIPPYPSASGDSDPSYGYLAGTDSYAEVIVGRFSATTPAELETQVLRTLRYEMFPDPSGDWYHKGICVGSDQGPGDDNEMDFEHERNIRSKYLGYTYTDVDEIYDGSQGGLDAPGSPGPSDLVAAFNDGRSILTYTGHGSMTSFGTTGFSTSDISSLANNDMLPFVWSVACVNGDFNLGTCLAEGLMRATSPSGEAIGTVATLMSTINQSWDPPMDGQDEMVDLLTELYPSNIKHTFGGLSVNGCMHMNDVYGTGGDEMTDTWTCFGDPSLMVRTATPEPLTATHDATIDLNTTLWTVGCPTNGALVCLSFHNQIVSTGYTLGGSAFLSLPQLTLGDTLDLTITAYNTIPYFATVVVVPSGTTSISLASSSSAALSVSQLAAGTHLMISFSTSASDLVRIDGYSITGQKVCSLLDQQILPAGQHSLTLSTDLFSQGVYFIRLTAGDQVKTCKVVVR